MAQRIGELGVVAVRPGVRMLEFFEQFLAANPGDVTERWLNETRTRLKRAVQFFGTDRDLKTIRPRDVREWLDRFLHLSASNHSRRCNTALTATGASRSQSTPGRRR